MRREGKERIKELKSTLDHKVEDGLDYWWYPGIGWLSNENLTRGIKDILEREATIEFLYNPDNSMNCYECPRNQGQTGDCYPCGQYNCWVDVHTQQ